MQGLNLYTIKVYSERGAVGNFLIAAVDREQAKGLAGQWASEHSFKVSRIDVARHSEPRLVFAPGI